MKIVVFLVLSILFGVTNFDNNLIREKVYEREKKCDKREKTLNALGIDFGFTKSDRHFVFQPKKKKVAEVKGRWSEKSKR